MNRFKFDIILKEFPFMEKIIPDDVSFREINEISVKRIDKNLLTEIPHIENVGNSLFTRHNRQEFWMICGEEFYYVCPNSCIGTISVSYDPDADWDKKGESILEGLDNFQDPDFCLIVEHNYNYDSTRNDNSFREYIIYKPGKVSIKNEIEAAKSLISSEINREFE